MSLSFTWSDLWAYYSGIEDCEIKVHLQMEIIGDDWLYRQSAKSQETILKEAPKDFLEAILPNLSPEVAVKLGFNPFIRR